MIKVNRSKEEWVSLQEASVITGKSITALRMMIKRRKIDEVKKMPGKRGEKWVIRKEALSSITDREAKNVKGDQKEGSQGDSVITLPAEIYLHQQKERDQAVQGMMMYRYKFEELDKKLKLLPAPVEVVSEHLKQKKELERTVSELNEALEKERNKPWWKKLMGLK